MLPQPSDAFAWVQAPPGPALVCRPLEPFAAHLFTTRPWRLGSGPASDREAGWLEVAAAMDVGEDRVVRVAQIHGASVFLAGPPARPPADIIVSRDTQMALAIQTADCVPLLIADRATGACAAVHAGWRGMAARAPQRAVEALRDHFGSRPRDLVAAIGPAIGACCYEVGVDVRDAFREAGLTNGELSRCFADMPRPTERNPSMPGLAAGRPAHWFFDGWAAVQDQLEAAGIPPDDIHTAALCTASHGEVFCSYRREGRAAGRLVAVMRPRRFER